MQSFLILLLKPENLMGSLVKSGINEDKLWYSFPPKFGTKTVDV